MPDNAPRSRGSLFGAAFLIILGSLFLYSNLQPEWNPWPWISRFWPVLLIALGLGKLFDALRARSLSPGTPAPRRSGEGFAILAVVLLLCLVFVGARRNGRWSTRLVHESKSVEAQGADTVRMSVDMPAGDLRIAGGAAKLLDADFDYSESEGRPEISYDSSGSDRRLSITQNGSPHIGRTENTWSLRLNNDEVRELRIEMGAGRGDLNLNGIRLSKLDVEIGAGDITTDLTGDWKQDVTVRIEGGAGRATIRLPRDIGVRVRASGGIGSIDVEGLRHDGDNYVNSAYGKSSVTMDVTVEGGVGQIRLIGN